MIHQVLLCIARYPHYVEPVYEHRLSRWGNHQSYIRKSYCCCCFCLCLSCLHGFFRDLWRFFVAIFITRDEDCIIIVTVKTNKEPIWLFVFVQFFFIAIHNNNVFFSKIFLHRSYSITSFYQKAFYSSISSSSIKFDVVVVLLLALSSLSSSGSGVWFFGDAMERRGYGWNVSSPDSLDCWFVMVTLFRYGLNCS